MNQVWPMKDRNLLWAKMIGDCLGNRAREWNKKERTSRKKWKRKRKRKEKIWSEIIKYGVDWDIQIN